MNQGNKTTPLQQIQLANLKDRIEAARHRQSRTKFVNEYERLMDAKFYDNMANNQFSGAIPLSLKYTNVSRDSLNPAEQLRVLQDRIKVTQYYNNRLTYDQRFWVPSVMRRVFRNLWTYKFNYLVKAAFVANALFYFNYDRQTNKKVILSYDQMWNQKMRLLILSGMATFVCLII